MTDSKRTAINKLERELRDIKGNLYLLKERAGKIVEAVDRVQETIELVEESEWMRDGDGDGASLDTLD